ncbi:MAG: class I SAM-dependent methyltransferase [Polyangiaceae bacterium]|jgi:2-polyprenyl-3-methyl-5-hydroxy-6-metoxy-1,4-benzoquinol methylase
MVQSFPYAYMEEVNEGIVREFRRLLPFTGRALDVGCGRGQLGEAVAALGWDVWGIEQSVEAISTAERRLRGLVQANLTNYDLVRRALPGRFDALILSDVLEHLYDPASVLQHYLEFVKPGGRVFVSLPNAVVWTNRFAWALGRVEYEDTGVMDRTHIRFFTFKTAKELVTASGCRVERVASTPHLARAFLPAMKAIMGRKKSLSAASPRALIDSPAYKTYMKFVYPAEQVVGEIWPTMLAFRIIVVGRTEAVDIPNSPST